MTEAVPSSMTVDAFLAWAEERPGRYELELGTVIAVSPESPGHLRAKVGARDALAAAIRKAGLAGEVSSGDATLRIDARTAYRPDALLTCGPRPTARVSEVSNPVIVIEVVSSSSEAGGRGGRLVDYFALASVQHYLIVDADRRLLVHHARRGDEIATRILYAGPLRLDPPGLDLRIEDLFGGAPEAEPDPAPMA